ncbi:MAG: hypothetical protein U9O96_06925 [Candidatus Thermoplasmatota archaeon]|nr:hypothetical protein [Candidatus Thermoplasmatota archaeon]
MKYRNRSKRGKKTIQARVNNGKLFVYLPAGISEEEEKKRVDKMEERKRKQRLDSNGQLAERAQELNKKYFDGKLKFEIWQLYARD